MTNTTTKVDSLLLEETFVPTAEYIRSNIQSIIKEMYDFSLDITKEMLPTSFETCEIVLTFSASLKTRLGQFEHRISRIVISGYAFAYVILNLLNKKVEPAEILAYAKTQMIFTLIHELGHFVDSLNNVFIEMEAKYPRNQIELISYSDNPMDLLNNEDYLVYLKFMANFFVNAEKTADSFALNIIEKNSPLLLKRLERMQVISRLDITQRIGASRFIENITSLVFDKRYPSQKESLGLVIQSLKSKIMPTIN